jgi:glycosidase
MAATLALTPVALIGCGDDDDNGVGPGTGGSAGTPNKAGNGGSAGDAAGGSAGNTPGACTPSAGLARAAGVACSEARRVCAQQFSFDPATSTRAGEIVSVQVRGNFLADTAWGTGPYMTLDGADGKWKATLELPPGKEVEYQFYVLHAGEAWNAGEWLKDPAGEKVTPACEQPACPTAPELWSPKQTCASQPPTKEGQTFDWRDAVIYFAFVDRFYNADVNNDGKVPGVEDAANYLGGDYAGVKAKIDSNYFTDLGVNTLWLTVPFDNVDNYASPKAPEDQCAGDNQYNVACFAYTGYHGYWPIDQWPLASEGVNRTEDRFGTEEELRQLVKAAHDKGIKVVFDYAMVHVHEESPLYKDALNNPASPYVDWFTPKYAVNETGEYIDSAGAVIVDAQGKPYTSVAPAAGQPANPNYLTTGQIEKLPATHPLAVSKFECTCGTDICAWDGTSENPTIGERCWFQGYLPHLNYKNQAARDYSIGAALRFLQDIGADGFRLDAVKHINEAWYTSLRAKLNEYLASTPGLEKERFYLVGETYDFNSRYNLDRFIDPATKLDGQFDFPFRAQAARTILKRDPDVGLDTFARFMESNDDYYGCDAVMSPWIGNHDVGRPIHIAEDLWDQYSDAKDRAWTNQPPQPAAAEPYERLANAFAVMMTNPGAPLIYYGDEFGLAGAGDPDNRRAFFDAQGNYAPNPNQQLLNDRLKKYTAIRAQHSSLRRGVRTTLAASKDVWVYKMANTDGSDEVFVALNRADAAASSCGDLPAGAYTDLVTSADVQGESLTIPPRQTLVLVKKP